MNSFLWRDAIHGLYRAVVGLGEHRLIVALVLSVFLHVALIIRFDGLGSGPQHPLHPRLHLKLREADPGLELTVESLRRDESRDVSPAVLEPASNPLPKPARLADLPLRRDTERTDSPVQDQKSRPVVQSSRTQHVAAEPAGGALPGQSGLLKRAEIEFEIRTGNDRQEAGTARHVFVSEQEQYYGITVSQSTLERESVQGERWSMEISGRLTMHGLSPTFLSLRGEMSERLMAIRSTPTTGTTSVDHERNRRMRDGLLDRQSLIYQFMVQPPSMSGGMMYLSDGPTYARYTYRVAGFDAFTITSLGGVRAVKLVLESAETPGIIELWVVPDLHYLPVKVRYVDPKGEVTEMTATSLDFVR